ncbi:DUF1592 domain-containing protein [Planctomicrobium piriforme]|uniref:PA14 domain-containing protein n=1 Tax=Planctomicrobium piriforme TaxID=1576369 RepID=A0A1I3GY40_9PLAN|nr:DUF1592 domain-containing protein [Planctomicrobium piriforme]SFI28276.1 Protein of unknown function [Planctomicrobium piriforme]
MRSHLVPACATGISARNVTVLGMFSLLIASPCFAEGEAAQPMTPVSGAAVYADQCARCHGPNGEGTKDYPTALTGDKSVLELKQVIAETMPEDKEQKCSASDAQAVAVYMSDKFYSVLAQERNRPATVEFSRLTVHQFENTVGDLIGSFRWNNPWYTEHGLHAEYYNLRSFDKKKRIHDRVDPVVNFSFGSAKPEGFPTEPDMEKRASDDIHDDQEFSIKWDGSIQIPETGDYEFIVESENGVRLYLNDWERPVFDAWVRSGSEKVYRYTTRLIGGRSYPFGLHFFRYKEPTASVILRWKRPGHVEEVIPERFLAPKGSPGFYVLKTPFPPDDQSIGYERGNSISKAWQEAVTMSALETAGYVVDNLNSLAGIKKDMPEEEKVKKRDQFCSTFVERAFRRPLSDDEKKLFVEQPRADVPLETGIKRVVLLALISPQFLYREAGLGEFNDFSMASWLSYSMWDSMPDRPLLDAAAKGELRKPDQIRRQVDRMAGDPRTQAKLKEFLRQWLRIDHFPEIAKNQTAFPEFNAAMVSDLRSSLDLSLDEFVTNKESDFRKLLLDDSLYLNGRLAAFYGAQLPADSGFQKVSQADQGRAGMLTHPLLLAGFAYDQESSPIHRGVFIARSLLGRRLKPPPEAVAPLAPDLHAGLSTRERVLLQTSPAVCQTCHSMINDLGFPLEHFDAAGRYRQVERDRPIDADGSYLNRSGTEVEFAGSRGLAEFLVSAPEVHEAFVEQLFHFTVKQPIRAFGPDKLNELTTGFAKNNFNVHKLLKEIVVMSAVRVQELQKPSPAGTDKLSSVTP